MARRKVSLPELKVVFDTNALYTEAASDLLRQEVSELIRQNNDHQDVAITWYLPEVVRHERQYQMSQRALKFLETVERLEKLLGHNLNITKDNLADRVETVIKEHIQNYGLKILEIDTTKFDLRKMMLDAAYRRPPFEIGDKKEKGFRDALVAEAFVQMVESSTPRRGSLMVLVTNDQLLAEAVKIRTVTRTDVRILDSVEGLKGLINTLVSTVDETFVTAIQPQAAKFFFQPKDTNAFIYKQKVIDQIKDKFKEALQALPEGAELRENGNYVVFDPRFVKKVGRRIFWATRIELEAKAYKYRATENPPTPSPGERVKVYTPSAFVMPSVLGESQPSLQEDFYLPYLSFLSQVGNTTTISPSPLTWRSEYSFGLGKQKILVKSGLSRFEVIWSVNRNPDGRLSGAKIEEINLIEATWSEP